MRIHAASVLSVAPDGMCISDSFHSDAQVLLINEELAAQKCSFCSFELNVDLMP